ncbi:hypothetical protein [Herbaspirillum robiniae]|uniref:hypothetical protein n=1 Tax=Herbaspirillum robiniae TaxID=2014887 RepID=UPI00101AD0F9|nr:hypothetical protein [Herbaspirillum robiniae]
MAKFRVTYQIDGDVNSEQLHFEIPGEVISCDDVLCALGSRLKPSESWPFVVATIPLSDDADITERAIRLHRIKAACNYLSLSNISYLLEGQSLEIYC